MVSIKRQLQALISEINNQNINQQVQTMAAPVSYILSPSEGNIIPGGPQGLNIYL